MAKAKTKTEAIEPVTTTSDDRVAELMRRGHGQPMAEHIAAKERAAAQPAQAAPDTSSDSE